MGNGPDLWRAILREFPAGSVIAGGCVRDYLLRREPKDIDVFVPSQVYAAPDGFCGLGNGPNDRVRLDEYEALGYIDVVTRGTLHGVQCDAVGLPFSGGAALVETFDLALTRCWFDGEKIHDTDEAQADRLNRTVTRVVHDRPERSEKRARRFIESQGPQWSYVVPA